MEKNSYPVTPAVRFLREKKVLFSPHQYEYVERGGTKHSAESLGVSEHSVIKTLVLENEAKKPLLVLMHGDAEVSTKQLARLTGAKSVTPCTPETATKHTGYLVGGTSPFGTKHPLPVYAEATIFQLDTIYINGGKRGFLVSLSPAEMKRALPVTEVSIAIYT